MASSDVQWMPTTGRHQVHIGSSLGRALKARKGGAPPPKKSHLPDRDFYSFRYVFKPESITTGKPGTIDVKRGKDATSVTIERPSLQAGENHVFKGTEQPAKEWECVLIYDEETGTYTLEKLDSFVSFNYDGRSSSSNSNLPEKSASPIPPPPATRSKEPARDIDSVVEELERDLDMQDADGEPDEEYETMASYTHLPEEEEEEEEECFIPPPKVPTPPAPVPKAKPVAASRAAQKQAPTAKPAPAKPVPAKPASAKPVPSKPAPTKETKPRPKLKGSAKRAIEPSGLEDSEFEEVLNFGVPARPAKRAKPVPASTSSRLALPDGSSGFTSLPPPPARSNPPPVAAAADSDSDEDWDEVAGIPPAPLNERTDAEVEVDEEIDLDSFEREMQLELQEGSDDDILAAAMSPEPEPSHAIGRPISLNQFAGGQFSQDEDDTSSSDDSDDD